MRKISNFDDDLFGLRDFADRLEKFISVEHEYVEGSLVIALNSSFGTGKSTFLNMWIDSLEKKKVVGDVVPLVVNLNAWESDYYGDPLFAIIYALIDTVEKEKKSADSLINAAKKFGWFATAIGSQVVNKATGIDLVAVGEFAAEKQNVSDASVTLGSDSFSIFKDRKDAMYALKGAIQSFVLECESQVLFLVDELDRCRPDYAISYLETIKHLFDVKGAVFLLAADRHQLECSAKTAFGVDLKFDEYYRKFVHREISLPKITHGNYRGLANQYVTDYFENEGSRICFMKKESVEQIIELIAALKLTPRQIQEVFRILGHIFETSKEREGGLFGCLGLSSILLAVLKVGNSTMFTRLGVQSIPPKEAYDFLKNLFEGDKDKACWWFALLLSGQALKIEDGQQVKDILHEIEAFDGDESSRASNLTRHWYQEWSCTGEIYFAQIHEKIEQLLKWD